MQNKTLTPILLAGIFFLMLGLSFAAVPLYDLFCKVTGLLLYKINHTKELQQKIILTLEKIFLLIELV